MAIPAIVGRIVGSDLFNKHALVSALLPNIGLWGFTGYALGQVTSDDLKSVDAWTTKGIALGAIVLLATYVTLNIQPWLLNFFRGEWRSLIGRNVGRLLSGTFARSQRAFHDADSVLAQQRIALFTLRDLVATVVPFDGTRVQAQREGVNRVLTRVTRHAARTEDSGPWMLRTFRRIYSKVGDQLSVGWRKFRSKGHNADATPSSSTANRAPVGRDDIAALQRDIDGLDAGIPTVDVIRALCGIADKMAEISGEVDAGRIDSSETRKALDRDLTRVTATMSRKIDGLDTFLDAARDRLLASVRGRLPRARSAIASTRLGNAFRAAEEELQLRYGIDPWLLIPHLRMVLPAGYAENLLAESFLALGLMTTLAGLLPLFAIALWVAILSGSAQEALLRPQSAFVVVFVALCFSFLLYRNAVEAAVSYCDGIKALFDAHRARILTLLRVQIPSSLEDERVLWRAVCEHLSRGTFPDPRYFKFSSANATELLSIGSLPKPTTVVAAARPVPALTELRAEDLVSMAVYPQTGDRFVVAREQKAKVEQKVVLVSLSAGAPIPEALLVERSEVVGCSLFSIACTAGALPAGAVPGAKVSIHVPQRWFSAVEPLRGVRVVAVESLTALTPQSISAPSHSVTVLVSEDHASILADILATRLPLTISLERE